jgi:hypothetical protein
MLLNSIVIVTLHQKKPVPVILSNVFLFTYNLQGCIQKFPDWLPGARIANGTALCH